jgi:carboxyl-terminal processing protease
MSKPRRKTVLVGVAIALGLLASCVIGAVIARSLTLSQEKGFGLFWEAWKLVEDNQPASLPDDKQLTWGAIRGALETLDDPCVGLVEPVSSQVAQQNLSGKFGGIGASLLRDSDNRFMVEPIAGLPADRAGIQKGDILLKVGDTELAPSMTDDDVLGLIRGEVGTVVRLTLQHQGQSEPYAVEITREEIANPSIEWRMLDQAPGTGYIRLWIFSNETGGELKTALDELKAQGTTRLVLDLRGNVGGELEAAIAVASAFLPDGVVGYERHKDGTETAYDVSGGGDFTTGEMVVLVNGSTSSGAELVAGTLRDRLRAVLIGEKTLGCGAMLWVYELSDGSSLYLRHADLLTANRGPITTKGLSPDFLVSFTNQDLSQGRDPQLDRAIQYLTAGQ